MSTSEVTKGKERKINQLPWVVFAAVAFCVLIVLSLYIIEKTPSYIELPIHPPNYSAVNPVEDWSSITYSVYQGISRAYVWRREAINIYDKERGTTSWQAVVDHFDHRLETLGWIRSNIYAPCQVYLPEASFLPENEPDGYVSYRHENHHPTYDTEVDDFLCLAVWPVGRVSGSPDGFRIVLISVQPALFSKLIGIIP